MRIGYGEGAKGGTDSDHSEKCAVEATALNSMHVTMLCFDLEGRRDLAFSRHHVRTAPEVAQLLHLARGASTWSHLCPSRISSAPVATAPSNRTLPLIIAHTLRDDLHY